MKNYRFASISCGLLLLLNLFQAPAHASTISVDTIAFDSGIDPSREVSLGANFDILITVTDVVDLAAIELTLSWDASILSMQGVTQQDFFPPPVWYAPSEWDLAADASVPGELSVEIRNSTDPARTQSGSGRLFLVSFQAIGTGLTNMVLDPVVYSQTGDDPITSPLYFDSIENGIVGVDTAVVPLPAPVWLLLTGLLGLIGISRKEKLT